jgi:diguanylate cyclase (GGDEF)-like protein/PAS domain S-box-containing protein
MIADTKSIRVLLIDNNPLDGHQIQEMLNEVNGYSFYFMHAENLPTGLNILKEENIDVVVLDISLSDQLGFDTFHTLHSHSPEIPIVLLTGLDGESLGIKAIREGAQDYVAKREMDGNLLARSIRYAIESKSAASALQESERLFEKMFTSLRDAVFIIEAKSDEIINCNPAASKIFGYTRDDMLGNNFNFLFPDEKKTEDASRRKTPGLGRGAIFSFPETLMVRKNNEYFNAEFSVVPLVDDNGGCFSWVMIIRDITARKEAEGVLRESQERYMLAIQGANDGLWDWDLLDNEIYYSPRWKAMLGYEVDEISNSPNEWYKRVHPDDIDEMKRFMTSHFKGLLSHFESEHRMIHRDKSYRWVLTRGLVVRDKNGVPYRMAGSQTDITARKKAEEQLMLDALRDDLTGLPNRAYFLDKLDRVIERSKRRPSYNYAVLFLDLDRFKIINDSLGHALGDKLIVEIANLLRDCLRPGDTIARFGGDEFVILLDDIDSVRDAVEIADCIHEVLKPSIILLNHQIYTTASIGIVLGSGEYDTKEDVLRDADIAMYRAKFFGRARYALFDTEMRKSAIARLELENDLRHALDRDELELYYQPIIELDTNCLVGFEALLRWKHPEKGFVSPLDIIPIAEETGLIFDIGKWVIREACMQTRKWHDQFPIQHPGKININISVEQFNRSELIDQIREILEDVNLEPSYVGLEITENMLMENAEDVKVVLSGLRELGVKLLIDDFGTGYSSLNYLQTFPINILKIDSSFINRMGANGDRPHIVNTILLLARELGLKTVAEGVETDSQLKTLKDLGCEYAQGYFISRPLTSIQATELLTENIRSSNFEGDEKIELGELTFIPLSHD